MKDSIKKIQLALIGLLMMFCYQGFSQSRAQRSVKRSATTHQRAVAKHHGKDRLRTQPVYRPNRYRYPRHRRVVRTLPRHHVRIVHFGLPYYYWGGVFYTQVGTDYVVVIPPAGIRLSVLPAGHVRVVFGGFRYYYYSGIYYLEAPDDTEEVEGEYEVVNPPIGLQVNVLPSDAEEILYEDSVCFSYNEVIYKKIETNGGIVYEVVSVNNH